MSSNRDRYGRSFAEDLVEAVWQKGTVVPGYDPRWYRRDACGWWIARAEHGQTSKYGWEIDHVRPVAKGGSDHLSNLQPLHCENNRSKRDDWPNWSCAVRAA